MARKYQKVQALLPEIQRMLDSGMNQREVAEALGLKEAGPSITYSSGKGRRTYRAYQNRGAGSQPRPCRNTSMRTSG